MKNTFKLIAIILFQLISLASSNVYATDQAKINDVCASTRYSIGVLRDERILYIRVDSLCIGSTRLIGDSLRAFFKEHSPETFAGTVLDLRHTKPDAAFVSIAGIASVFLDPNVLINTIKLPDGRYMPLKTGKIYYQPDQEPDDLRELPEFLLNAPLAIMVSRETKSAPELLANTMLNNRNALLLGEEFENGVHDQIDLQNPFYQLLAPMLSIKAIKLSESSVEQKLYMVSESQVESSGNCTEEEIARVALNASQLFKNSVKYPRNAQVNGKEGQGTLIVVVDKKGNFISQYISVSTGEDDLDLAMLDAGQQTKFPSSDCLSETFSFDLPITFTLHRPITH